MTSAETEKQEPVGVVKDLFTNAAWDKLGVVGSTNVYLGTPPPPAQQEPVAYLCENAAGHKYFRWKKPHSIYKPTALYTRPPQRKPLTHEQRVDLLAKFEAHKHEWHAPAILIDMVEAAHGIKEKNHGN